MPKATVDECYGYSFHVVDSIQPKSLDSDKGGDSEPKGQTRHICRSQLPYVWNLGSGYSLTFTEPGSQTITIPILGPQVYTIVLYPEPAQPYISMEHFDCLGLTGYLEGPSSIGPPPLLNYSWKLNGTEVSTSQVYYPTSEGEYTLTIEDAQHCVYADTQLIRYSFNPIYYSILPTELCAGEAYNVTMGYGSGYSIQVGNREASLAVNDTVFLPDGIICDPAVGCSYRSPVTFTDFAPNAVVTSVEDILYVRLKIEHSYIGDIYINITCPNGQQADILKWSGSGSTVCSASISSEHKGWQGSGNTTSTDFGAANRSGDYSGSTASKKCDPALNPQGTGWNYCWSNNTTEGYTYAAGDGLVYRTVNAHNGSADSTNVAEMTQVYHPDESFASLVGCPLNGNWSIEVIDGWANDNGYIYSWELALQSHLMPQGQPPVVGMHIDGPWATDLTDSTGVIEIPSTLDSDVDTTYSFIVYQEDGCSFDTTVTIHIHAPVITVHEDTTCQGQAYSGYGFTVSASETSTSGLIIKKERRDLSPDNPDGCGDTTVLHLHVIPGVITTMPENVRDTVNCPSAVQAPELPVVTDACGSTITPTGPIVSSMPACDGSVTYTYTYTDNLGNSEDWTYTYTIIRPPLADNMPDDVTQDITCENNAEEPLAPEVRNACNETASVSRPAITNTVVNGSGDVIYTYTYTDCNGDTATWTYTYHVTPAPFTPFADSSSTVHCVSQAVRPTTPTIRICGAGIYMNLTSRIDSTENGCGTVIYNFSYQVNGTTYQWRHTYTVTPEDFTMPSNTEKTVTCFSNVFQPSSSVLPVVRDACGNILTPQGPTRDDSAYDGCEGYVTYTYTYTDCAGHSHDWVYTYRIKHPHISVNIPADIVQTVECEDDAHIPEQRLIRNSCGDTAEVSNYRRVSTVDVNGYGDVVYSYTYTDCNGDTAVWYHTYHVVPAPFTPVADMVRNVNCVSNVPSSYIPMVYVCNRLVDFRLIGIDDNVVDGCGSKIFHYEYTVNGILHHWNITYNVSPLDFTMPENITVTVNCPIDATHAPTLPSVTDACGRILTPTDTVISSFPECEGNVTYTYTYEDCAHHSHNWVYTYQIELPPLAARIPADGTGSALCEVDALAPDAPVVLNVCGDTASVGPVQRVSTVGGDGRGSVTYTYTYTDCNNDTASWHFTYTIEPAEFHPVADNGTDVHCLSEVALPETPVIIVCKDTVSLVLTGEEDNTVNGCGTYVYTFSYAVNEVPYQWHYTYNVSPEDFTMPADDGTTVSCPADATNAPTLPTVTDACGRILTPSAPAVSSIPQCEGNVTHTYTYTDCAGHHHDWVYTYRIELPAVVVPEDGTDFVHCANEAVEPSVSPLTDACGRSIAAVADEGNPFVNMQANGHGTVTYRYTYTDCTDDVYHWAYIYTVTPEDFEPVADDGTDVFCATAVTTPVTPTVEVCDSIILFTLDSAYSNIIDGCGDSVYVYSYTVNDTAYSWTYTWHVSPDDFASTMPANDGTTVYCLAQAVLPTASVPEVRDYCGRVLEPQVPESYAVTTYDGCEGNVTYTYTFEDCAHHTHNWVYTYRIQLPPLAERIPADGTDNALCEIDALAPDAPVVLNICGDTASVSPVQRVSTVGGDGRGTVTYTYTYTDCNNDNASWHYTYVVEPAEFHPVADESTDVHCLTEIALPETPVIIVCEDTVSLVLTSEEDNTVNGCGTYVYTFSYSVNEVPYQWHYTYNVSPEDFTMPANDGTTVTCPADAGNAPTLPTVTDACGRVLTPSEPVVSTIPQCEGSVTHTYTYTDCAGHHHDWVYTYRIELPAVVVPGDGSNTVHCANEAVEPSVSPLTDACGRSIAAVADEGNPFVNMQANGHGTVTYRYTYTDCTDDVYHWSYTYTVTPEDFEPVADDGTNVFCATAVTTPVTPTVEVCDSIIPFTLDSAYSSIVDGCGDSVYVYEYTVNDTAYRWTYTWHVSPDDFASTMPGNDETTVYCLTQAVLPTASVPEVRDYCGRILNPQTPESYAVTTYDGCEGNVTYTYTFEDCAHHTHNWVYTYRIQLPPLAERIPADGTGGALCEIDALVPDAPVVLNVCGDTASVSPVQRISNVGGDGRGTVVYTYTYTDCNNDTASWHYTYIVEPAEFHPVADGSTNVHCLSEVVLPESPIITVCGDTVRMHYQSEQDNTVNGCGTYVYTFSYAVNEVPYQWHYTYNVSPEDFTMPANDGTTVTCPADAGNAPTLPTVTDACGRILTPSEPVVSSIPQCEGSVTHTYTYTDCAGHHHDWVYTYRIELPAVVVPEDGSNTVHCANEAVEPSVSPLTDACGRSIAAVADEGNPFVNMQANGHGTVTYRYTYTDCTDDVYHWAYTYTVTPEDFEPVADDGTDVFCATDVTTPVTPTVEVCDSIIPFTLDSAYSSIIDGCGDSVYIYSYTVNDTAYSWTYTWHVSPDDFASTMPANDGTTVYCLAQAVLPTASVPEVRDYCGRVLEPQVPESYAVTTYDGCEGNVTYTYTFEDCAHHTHNWVYTYRIQLPPLSERIPADGTGSALCEVDALVPDAPVVLNICGDTAAVSPVQRVSTVGGDGRGTVTYTYTYTDCNNDNASWHFTYTIEPAEFHPVADESTDVHCLSEVVLPESPVITVCGDTVRMNYDSEQDNTVNGCGTYVYTFSYAVNEVPYQWHYTYNISPEDFTMPADDGTTVSCPADAGNAPTLPTVTDACGRVLTPSEPAVSSIPQCEGSVTHTYTYTDCAGHHHDWVYTYRIELPSVVVPEDGTNTVHCANEAVEPSVSPLTDACGRSIAAVADEGNPFVNMQANGHGTVTYRYTYTDCTDDVYHWAYIYTVTPEDFEPVADDGTDVFCATAVTTPVTPTVEVCDSIIPFTLDSAYSSIVDGCGDSVYVYEYTVNDTAYRWTYTWHVSPDDFASTMPANDGTTVYCLAQAVLPTASVPEVRDYCGRVLEPQAPESYAVTTYDGCEGNVTYTYTFEDCTHHTHNWVYTYRIQLPPLSERIPADGTGSALCEVDALVPDAPVVLNICGDTAAVSPVQRVSTVGGDGRGTVTYTYTYTDCNNDNASWHFTYTIEPAEFHPVADESTDVHCLSEVVLPESPVITVCGDTVRMNYDSEQDNTVNGCGTYVYTFSYAVNEVPYQWHYTYNISPEDFTMPADDGTTVSCPADATNAPTLPTVTDACGRVLTPSEPAVSTIPQCEGSVTHTYTYTDCAGHHHDWVYTYLIELPAVVVPGDGSNTVHCANEAVEPSVSPLTDACGRSIAAVADEGNPFVNMQANGHGTVTYRYTYTDCTDDVYHWSYTYTVTPEDFEPVADDGTNVFCATAVTTPVTPTVEVCDSIIPFTLDSAYSNIIDGCGDSVYVYSYTVNDTAYRWTYTWHVSPDDFASTMPANDGTTVYCLAQAVLPTASVPEVRDYCGRVLEPQVPESYAVTTYDGCEGNVTYTYGYTDCAGHHHDWVFTYRIQLPPLSERIPADGTGSALCEVDALVPDAPVVLNICGDTASVGPVQRVSTVGGDGRGTVTYTYTYTDCNNDNASWHFTYTIEPAEFDPIADDSTNVHCLSEAVQPEYPSITVCGETIIMTLTDEQDNTEDGCGNYIYTFSYAVNEVSYQWHYTYLISPEDFVMPADRDTIVTCPADVHSPALPLVTDACGRILHSVDSLTDALPSCEGSISYRYTYKDCAEHSHVWTYTYTIQPHPLNIPADRGSVIACKNQAAEPTTDILTDDCGRIIAAVADQGNPFVDMHANGHGTVIYRYTYTDCTDSVYHWTYTYTVTPDDFEPVADDGADVFCATDVTIPVTPTVEVCDSIIPFTLDSVYSSIADGCGDSVYVYSYTVNDTLYHWTYTWHVSPADFAMPANDDTTVYCLAHVVLPTTFVPEVRDYCGRILEPQIPESYAVTTYNGCEGNVTYTYGYTDCAGHHHDWVFTYHILLPALAERIPEDETTSVNCEVDASVPDAPVVLNICGDTAATGPVQRVSTVRGNGRGTVVYTYTYTDCNNDTASWHFTYIVEPTEFIPIADDSTDVYCLSEIVQPEYPSIIVCGETVVMTLTDEQDNTEDGCGNYIYTFSYTVNEAPYQWRYTYWVSPEDFVMPADRDTVVTCPADVHSPALPLVTDACGRILQAVDSLIDALPSCEGSISYRYTYKDCAEHTHVWTYTYSIQPHPLIIPADRASVVACENQALEPMTDTLTDDCGRIITAVANQGNPFVDMHANGHGTVIYRYTYTDCTDSVYYWTYTYTVTPDDFEPVANVDTNVFCLVEVGTPVLPVVVVCDSTIPFTLDSVYSSIIDGCGDSVYVYSYTVNDTLYHWTYTWHVSPADFVMPANEDTTVYCLAHVVLPTTFVPEIRDYCGRILEPQVPESYAATTYDGCEGDVTYTYGYTDCAGHHHDWVFTYHIQLPPLAERIPDNDSQNISCERYAFVPTAPVVMNVCGDTASVAPVQRVSTVGGNGRGSVTYTYTYTDCNNDTASWHFTYIVVPDEYIPVPDDSTSVHCFVEIHQPVTPVIISCEDTVAVNLINAINNVVDGCGNFVYHYQYEIFEVTYDWRYTYWVSPEEFVMPADRDTVVTCPADVHSPVLPLVTDACGRVLLPVDSVIDVLPSCEGIISYRYTYKDCAEHTHVWTYTYSIQPHPLIIPADRASVVACANQALEPMTDTLTDDCGRVITAVANQGNPFVDMHANGHGTVIYRYTYTDCTDSVYHWTYTYTVTPEDFEPVANADTNVFCLVEVGTPVLPVVVVCDSTIPFTLDSVYSSIIDGCGDSVYVYEYTVNDTLYHWTYIWHVSPADFAMPANEDTTVYCLAHAVLPTTFVPEIRDYCGRILEPQVPESYAVTTYNGCEGDVTYTYGYTDCAGHHHDWVFTYHIQLPPLAERIPANDSQNISCERYAFVPTAPVVMNVCGDTASVAPVQRVSTVGGNGRGSVTYTYTYTDCNNDTASWHFTYIVVPDEYIPVPDDSTSVHCFVEIHQPVTPVIISCEDTVAVNLINAINNVVDGCGNFVYHYQYEIFEVTYDWRYTYWVSPEEFVMPADRDTVVTCPADVHSPTLPLVSDACGRVLQPVDSVIDALPSCEGIISYRYTYKDCAEHTHVWTYTYSIQPHPLIIPADRGSVVACANQALEPMTDTLIDDCGRVITAVANQNNPFVDMHANGHGTVTYRYTYTDCTDSVYHWTYIYTVIPEDFEPVADADTNVFCLVEVVTPVLPVVVVCDSIMPFTLDSVYSSIIDGCGDSVYVYEYTVNDTLYHWTYIWHVSPADFAMPANDDTTVYCLAHAVLPTTFVPEIRDYCGRILEPQIPAAMVVTTYDGCEGDVTYTYGYTDCAGHHHDWVFTYHIQLPPLAERIPADETRYVACEVDATVPEAPVVMNVCGVTAAVSPVHRVSTVGGDGRGTVTYTYTYTDCNNDTASWHFTYIVVPDEFIPAPDDSTFVHCFVEIHQPTKPIVVICGEDISINLIDSVNNVVDGCGNFIYHYQYEVFEVTYDWYYTYWVSPEDFVMPADRDTTVTCPADVHTPTLPLVSDACGRVLQFVASQIDTLPSCEGVISYRYTYEDCAGHSHVWTYTYRIDRGFTPIEIGTAITETFVECISEVHHPSILPVYIDACNDTLRQIYTPEDYTITTYNGCNGDVEYTYVYQACTGDTISWTYTYHIADTTHPQYDIPAPMTLCRNIDGSITADTTVTGCPFNLYDNCTAVSALHITHQDVQTNHRTVMDTITRIWYVNDFCGNITVHTQYIYIRPVPVITLIDDREMCDDVISNCYVDEQYPFYHWSTGAGTRAISASVPGTYNVTVMDVNGCYAQSDIELILYPNPIKNIHIPSICQFESSIIDMGYSSQNSIELYSGNDYVQVDSFHFIGPNVQTYGNNRYLLSAPPRMLHDTTITYTIIAYGHNGCTFDSVKSVDFHMVEYSFKTDTACDRYEWHGRIYTESGYYIDTLQTIFGCDSITNLYLTVFYSTTGDTVAYACDSFTWYGETFTESTEAPTHVFVNSVGCDSTVTLHLTIYPSYLKPVPAHICEGDGYEDQDFHVSKEETIGIENLVRYRYLESIHGCDSVIRLDLSITDTSMRITPSSPNFCDEFELDLTVVSPLPFYLWSTGETNNTIHVTSLGTFTVIATDGVCSNSAQFTIKPCEFELYLPNTITASYPDGLNDYFCINERQQRQISDKEFSIVIYNRTGQLIFESTNKNFKWDGKANGRVLEGNMYVYVIRCKDLNNQLRTKKGTILTL